MSKNYTAIHSFEDYCPKCLHYDVGYGACSEIHENVRNYPNRFVAKCNGKYFKPDPTQIEDKLDEDKAEESNEQQEFEGSASLLDAERLNEKYSRDVQEVIDELEELNDSNKSWYQNLLILIISLLLFVSFGLFKNPIRDLIILIIVILIHEMGHFIAMNKLGYKNVQMFFIPLFGAAVSGKGYNISGTQRAIVDLAGPIPGIIIGFLLALVYFITQNEIASQIAIMFLFINGFNLLPFYPFDGGRFIFDILFCRNRYAEAIFKLIAGVSLLLIGIYGRAWLIGVLGVVVLITIKNSFKLSTIANELRNSILLEKATELCNAPPEVITQVIGKVNINFFSYKPKIRASLANDVWEKINTKSPRIFASISMLFLYIIFILMLFVIFAVISTPALTTTS